MTTTLLIARHGNTFGPGDVVTRVGGRTDLPLVESGHKQGEALGRYLAQHDLRPDIIFTSRLQRTQQTADAAEAALGAKVARQATNIFDEIDYGPDENQPEDIVKARVGEAALKAWDESGIVPPGWKVDPALIIRAWKDFAAEALKTYTGKKVLVVTSNGIARFAPHLTGGAESFQKQHGIKISTGALCIFTNSRDVNWTCAGWNIRPDRS